MIKDPYESITKENFSVIKDMLMEGMLANVPPHDLAVKMAEKTGMGVEQCRMIIMNEYFAFIDKSDGVSKRDG